MAVKSGLRRTIFIHAGVQLALAIFGGFFNMKKRVLALLLAMVMIFGMLPVSAFATEATDPAAVLCETEGCEYAL